MTFQSFWYNTKISEDFVNLIEKDISKEYSLQLNQSKIGGNKSKINLNKRDSQSSWIPANHWVAGLIWHYVKMANDQNFLYDISNIDGNSLQYTVYEEGQFYSWHQDGYLSTMYSIQASNANLSDQTQLLEDFANTNLERVRKLSFSLLLNDDYEGGEFQFLNENSELYEPPKERGTIIIFDSRTRHRVRPIKKGVRKSIVGWVVGPRWK